jgi:hypothetical protein
MAPENDAWFISQSVFEAVLRAELQKGGYAVEFGSELIKFQQDEYGVVADIMRTGVGFEQIDASFLVGTDGAKGMHGFQLIPVSLFNHLQFRSREENPGFKLLGQNYGFRRFHCGQCRRSEFEHRR